MISLLISFLLSIGWMTNTEAKDASIKDLGGNRYGVVITDETQQRYVSVVYNADTGTFVIEE